MERRRPESASNLLASGYTSTMLAIAALSVLACTSLLVTMKAVSDLDPELEARIIR